METINCYLRAYSMHKAAAEESLAIFRAHCGGRLPPRVPGMDTVIRLAWRIECGADAARAAALEYVYRWNLAVRDFDQLGYGGRDQGYDYAVSIFGTPHVLGM